MTTRVLVVGGGVAGLAAAYWIAERSRAAGRALDVRVLEAASRPGGNARTEREDGFLVEAGPNGWLDREPAARTLLRELGLEAARIEARPQARNRYIVRGGRLCRVPDSPLALLTSPALSVAGRLRLVLEPFAPGPPAGRDETVFEFARRRIGAEAAEFLVDAAISGISAGDSRRLSVGAAFPLMVEMERAHGSLIRAMIARRRSGPTRLVSLERGVGSLVDALARALGDRLRTGAAVASIRPNGGGFRVALADGGELRAERVVLALPAWHAARITGALGDGLARDLEAVPAAGLAVVALAFRRDDVAHPLTGYGHLVTRREGADTLGVVWESSLFEGRAPSGTVLLRAMLGGVRRPECVAMDAADLERRALREMTPLLGLRGEPIRRWVFWWPRAIPQYECGHSERLGRMRQAVAMFPGLELCGSSYDGVAFASAIASADRVAARVLADGAGGASPGEASEAAGELVRPGRNA